MNLINRGAINLFTTVQYWPAVAADSAYHSTQVTRQSWE
jgi:hypothetical protein